MHSYLKNYFVISFVHSAFPQCIYQITKHGIQAVFTVV